MIRAALLSVCTLLLALPGWGGGRATDWSLEGVQSLPAAVPVEEAARMFEGDTKMRAGRADAVWFQIKIQEPGDFVVNLPEAHWDPAQAWVSTARGRWLSLPQSRPARNVAFEVSSVGTEATTLLVRIPQNLTAASRVVEVTTPERYARRQLWANGLLAFVIGALSWVFIISLYIRLRLKRWRSEGLMWMSALVLVSFFLRTGGLHLLTDGALAGVNQAVGLLVKAAALPWAFWAMHRARLEVALNVRMWALIYLMLWVLLASGMAFGLLPAAWFSFGFHLLFFAFGLIYANQIQSRPTPLQLTFLTMVFVEGVLGLGVLMNLDVLWCLWWGAFLELVFLVWSLVRMVNEGFADSLNWAAERHEFENLQHKAYTLGLEEEKKRIASELHDDVLGSLVLMTHGMSLNNPLRPSIQNVIAKIRRLTMNLSPYGVVDLPFEEALERLAKSYRSDDMEVWLHSHASPEGLPERVHFELFRMLQEVLQNVHKHANANRVDISLDWNPTESILLLTIEDNGIGFDPATVKRDGAGLGLENLKSRAQAIGALLTIESSPGSGTYISIEWVNE